VAKTTAPNTVVIVDDEPHNMLWLVDYFSSKGMEVIVAHDANEALEIIEKEVYRALIIDLNIPILEPIDLAAEEKGTEYRKYPGLFVGYMARNRGYRDRQVILYSVHKDAAVSSEASKIGCSYIIKGRPQEIKREIEAVISFDPTEK